MHEYPLTLNIIEIASGYAARENARVRKINLVIGEASGILGDSIRLYFGEIACGTICEGAEIDIERVKPLLRCNICGRMFQRKPFTFACAEPGCPGDGIPTETGREFYIKSVEVEDKD